MTLIHSPYYGESRGLKVKVSAKAATALVSTADIKTFCRVDSAYTGDDTLLDTLVDESTELAQEYTNRSFINRTLIAEWDAVQSDGIALPYGQVQSISEVATIASDGTATVLSTGSYDLRNDKLYITTSKGLRVTYVSGYGANVSDVPAPITLAVKKTVLDQYDNRENQITGTIVAEMNNNSFSILDRYINYDY